MEGFGTHQSQSQRQQKTGGLFLDNTSQNGYWTIAAIEHEARKGDGSTFKGRAKESIIGFAHCLSIPDLFAVSKS